MHTGQILLVALALGAAGCADFGGPIVHGTFGKLFGGGDNAEQAAAPDTVPSDVRQRIVADLAGRLDVSPKKILTLSADPAVWENASLGCDRLSELKEQEERVEGYRIVLSYAEQRYDYRVRESGSFVLCEQIAVR
ncbi:MAG: hypothetical protein H0W33_04470 [Gammaproteobacteria bacterium]|nr:hypothetical protein [Gammaproteobacteria bacterium]